MAPHVGVGVPRVAVVESVEGHEGDFSWEAETIHGRQDPRTSLVCVHHVVEQPANRARNV